MLRWTTAGESHGRALVALVEGMVAGVQVTSAEIAGRAPSVAPPASLAFFADASTNAVVPMSRR